MNTKEMYGTGWEFPPKFERVEHGPDMLSGEEKILNSIYIILHTKLGERILRDEFGSNIYDLIFEPLTTNMKTFMSSMLKNSLQKNEPRIKVNKLTLDQPDLGIGRVDVSIECLFIQENVSRNLVIPFYLPEDVR